MRMEDVKKTVCKEIEKFPDKGDISIGELDILYKLVMIKEKLLRIEEIEQKMGGGEQNYGNHGNYGMWSAEGNYGHDYGNYGRDMNYGREMNYGSGGCKQKIEEMMRDASPHEREILKRTLSQM